MKSLASYQQTACGNIDTETLFAQNLIGEGGDLNK